MGWPWEDGDFVGPHLDPEDDPNFPEQEPLDDTPIPEKPF